MSTNLSGLCDAVATDIVALSLPAHTLWKYVDPPVLRADLGNILAVFPRTSDYSILSTSSDYDSADSIMVAWYAPVSMEDGGLGSPAVAASALGTAQTIAARLMTYAVAVPGIVEQNEGTLKSARYGLVGGGLWLAEFTLEVGRWPNA